MLFHMEYFAFFSRAKCGVNVCLPRASHDPPILILNSLSQSGVFFDKDPVGHVWSVTTSDLKQNS